MTPGDPLHRDPRNESENPEMSDKIDPIYFYLILRNHGIPSRDSRHHPRVRQTRVQVLPRIQPCSKDHPPEPMADPARDAQRESERGDPTRSDGLPERKRRMVPCDERGIYVAPDRV